MSRWAAVFMVLVAVGCVHTYELESRTADALSLKLSRQTTFYVGIPDNGRFGSRVYSGSGDMTAQAIVAALSGHVRTVRTASSPASIEETLAAARIVSASYIVQPTILHWEDRATEWSGIRDRMTIRLQLIRTSDGEVLNSTIISGKSRWATFGGDHPQDLLPEPLSRYVVGLF